jgi:amino acid efflux transporter
LLVVAVLSFAYFALVVATGGELEPVVLVHTSCMVAVYALGAAAAVRLLERGSAGWWCGVVACGLALGLAVLAGRHLLVPVALALVALAVGAPRRSARTSGSAVGRARTR